MTKKESQVKTKEKVSAIEILLRQLEVSIEAKQVVTDKGVIENMVFYRDNEKYTIEEPEETAPITDKKND
jgi:hypothetical protein